MTVATMRSRADSQPKVASELLRYGDGDLGECRPSFIVGTGRSWLTMTHFPADSVTVWSPAVVTFEPWTIRHTSGKSSYRYARAGIEAMEAELHAPRAPAKLGRSPKSLDSLDSLRSAGVMFGVFGLGAAMPRAGSPQKVVAYECWEGETRAASVRCCGHGPSGAPRERGGPRRAP